MGYETLYVSFEHLNFEIFWKSLGNAIRLVDKSHDVNISSRGDFFEYFRDRKKGIILLIDEFNKLSLAPDEIHDDFLSTLREFRNNNEAYAIDSIIAAGTASITRLNPRDVRRPPFNVGIRIQNLYFTVEETRDLFSEFAKENNIDIDDDVITDVWEKSGGHPGMVCLLGRIISDRCGSLIDYSSCTLPYRNWIRMPVKTLNDEINSHSTLRSMVESLCQDSARTAVQLLRVKFAGHLDYVRVPLPAEEDADFLKEEGVLLRPGASLCYRMASPLVDVLIQTQVIPVHFPSATSMDPPYRSQSEDLCVVETLIQSLKILDKDLIRLARFHSNKISNVPVKRVNRAAVLRESVYNTELTRILSSWLATEYGWRVWHMRTTHGEHKCTDIILQKDDNSPIILGLLATEDLKSVRSRIEKTSERMDLCSAKEGWVVHFTCDDDYEPVWQSDTELEKHVNVMHVSHDVDFTRVVMCARWWKGDCLNSAVL